MKAHNVIKAISTALCVILHTMAFAQDPVKEVHVPTIVSSQSDVDAKLAAKRAAAQALLNRDVIKMTAHIKDFGGIRMELDIEAYPKKGKMKTFKSGSHCLVSSLDTDFSIDDQGNIVLERLPRFAGCTHNYIVLDPIAKNITVYVIEPSGNKRRSGVKWSLDEN
jgi:soluble cytochrome b562